MCSLATAGCMGLCLAARAEVSANIDGYVRPYVQTHNFSGAVLVERNGSKVFDRAYGFADRDRGARNGPATRFHIASISMQFTAAAILRLVDKSELSLDEHVNAYAPEIIGADRITIRDLLEERSGLPDINSLPDYNEILQQHQTPQTLVAKIAKQPLQFEPGTKFLREEHSAYNLLALIVEKKTGLPFATAMEKLVFRPAGLVHTSIDDDAAVPHAAKGYAPDGIDALTAAPAIHWSAKTGNASVCTTAEDEARWVRTLIHGNLLSESSRKAMFDTALDTGYGWFKRENRQIGEPAFYMNGRSPGFSSFVMYLPAEDLTVVVLSNIYSSATTTMGYDVARIALGRRVEPADLGAPIPPGELKSYTGVFAFGPDFYQKNARLFLKPGDRYVSLVWPSGSISVLIPLGKDRFIDRSYWEPVSIERDASGAAVALRYGEFRGAAVR
jgi:CubicO group peptidase (beta-lactamase class C family)